MTLCIWLVNLLVKHFTAFRAGAVRSLCFEMKPVAGSMVAGFFRVKSANTTRRGRNHPQIHHPPEHDCGVHSRRPCLDKLNNRSARRVSRPTPLASRLPKCAVPPGAKPATPGPKTWPPACPAAIRPSKRFLRFAGFCCILTDCLFAIHPHAVYGNSPLPPPLDP